ncbi:MAG: transcriptional activator domain-containing protein [Acidimicrobiia bacterium]|nr:transcriptional activator domain-containing protein [Acidimicrobiia bacterium]
MAAGSVWVRLMGGFGVVVDGENVPHDAWRSRRASDLVKFLALAPRHRVTQEQVIDALWPDLDIESGGGNVRKAAHRARRAMGIDDGIILSGGMVSLAPDREIQTDVERFQDAAATSLREQSVTACRETAELYGGEMLPDDRYAAWCSEDRDRLRRRYLEILAGAELWGRLVDEEPTNEKAHQKIMDSHLANGDRRAVIRQFEHLSTSLQDELGVSPESASVELYEKALAMGGPDAPTPAERARALLAWGVVHWKRADLEEAKRTATEARALAIDAGLGRELSEASELLGLVAYAQNTWKEVFGKESVETIRETPDLAPFVLDAHICMSEFALWESDGITSMAEFADEIIDATVGLESPQGRAFGLLLRGEAELLRKGDPVQAHRDLEEAARLHEDVGCLTGLVLAEERTAQLMTSRSDSSEALRHHRRALDLAAVSPTYGHLLLLIYGGMLDGLDDLPAELALIREAEEEKIGLEVCDPCSMSFLVAAASATAASGDISSARRYLAEAERIVQMWREGPWHAAVTEATAAVRLAEGAPPEEVVGLLENAEHAFAVTDRPRERDRCRQKATVLS